MSGNPKYRIRLPFSTLALIEAENPVLLEGEQWTERDASTGQTTGRRKVGDGVTAFTSLPFEPSSGGGGGTAAGTTFAPAGTIAATNVQAAIEEVATDAAAAYAPAAQGVTNGNSHDHNGGDGAQIAYANLSGLPTLGTAAATATTDYAPAVTTSASITAGTNAQGQSPLTADVNVITTAANSPSGVTLPTAAAGRRVTVINRGANVVNVYPASGATIDGQATNVSLAMGVNVRLDFSASNGTTWFSTRQDATNVAALSGAGAGVIAALGTAVGTAGAPVLFNGAGGTPSSITLTNGTGLPAAGVTGLGTLATLSALGSITSAGAIGSTANLPIITTTGGALSVGSFGTTANTFCVGNDSRLSDARTPTAHNQAWSTITATPTTLSGYGITDGQPLDADLTSIAALTTTTFGRSQLTLADAAAATAQLNNFTSALKGLVPLSGGGTTNFLRADGTWAAPAGGGATNLTYTASTRVIASDTGTDATLPLVSSGDAGLAPASGGGTTNFLRADGTWTAPSGGGGSLTVQDEGGTLSAAVTTVNFTGAGVTATGTTTVTVDIPGGGSSNTFSTIAVAGQSNVVADSTSDTLTMAAGSGMAITTNATTDTVTLTATGPTLGLSLAIAYGMATP